MTILTIIAISVVGLLVGAAVLFGIVCGPLAVFASPFLAIFGWFYIFPIVLCVGLIWAVYQPQRNRPYEARLVVAASCVGASILMMAIGVRGHEPIWLLAYSIGGLVAGGTCGTMVVLLKKQQNGPNSQTDRP